jgi:hypothetical protein
LVGVEVVEAVAVVVVAELVVVVFAFWSGTWPELVAWAENWVGVAA